MIKSRKEPEVALSKCRVTNIRFPKPGDLRSRKVVSRSNTRPTIKYPSWKAQRMMYCESLNELNACLIFDADSSVVSFKEQPVKIEFMVDDLKYTHYPDFLVIKRGLTELVEVKEDLAKEPDETHLRTKILERSLPDFGVEYRVACGREMMQGCCLSNAKYLLRYGRYRMTNSNYYLSEQAFDSNKINHWSDFCLFDEQSKNSSLLCRLILEGFVFYDSTQPIAKDTKIYWHC